MRADSPEWISTLRAFVDSPHGIAVAGEDAGAVARALGLAFGLALTTEETDFALLGTDHPEANRVRDLPDDSVDVVLFRRAWSGSVEVGRAIGAAHRVLRSGGRIFAGERELDRLTRSSLHRYPLRAFVEVDPAVMEADLRTSVGRLGLAAGIVRAGFKGGTAIDVDETRGSYDDAVSFVGAFTDPQEAGDVVALLNESHRRRTIVDVDPWVYATGVKL